MIVLITLIFLLLIGGIEKLFFYKNKEKKIVVILEKINFRSENYEQWLDVWKDDIGQIDFRCHITSEFSRFSCRDDAVLQMRRRFERERQKM